MRSEAVAQGVNLDWLARRPKYLSGAQQVRHHMIGVADRDGWNECMCEYADGQEAQIHDQQWGHNPRRSQCLLVLQAVNARELPWINQKFHSASN